MFRAMMIMLLATLASTGILSPIAYAEDPPPEDAAALPATQYIYFEPAFVVNFGSTGRMRYIRTELALKVTSTTAAGKVSQHKPYIRHTLVMFLSKQEPETMNSTQGRENLRREALEEVRRTMNKLEGSPMVDDLYFNTFVVQN
ncbi:flagellar basal body-associated FliL family protein [Parathalassolituus penaei]|uniref:Flagellar protein FliL n=1 Tax=Parathalassolituus penaei TaxID=2997323 RepID=A0A9X3IT92_9GAMM|nr:flagellar basal body-associated FliL family protein [Parathalassolituus penaei]MCY0964958.1 flagellar basal body-associated FliL family protein [Parathalassolituus penaei]